MKKYIIAFSLLFFLIAQAENQKGVIEASSKINTSSPMAAAANLKSPPTRQATSTRKTKSASVAKTTPQKTSAKTNLTDSIKPKTSVPTKPAFTYSFDNTKAIEESGSMKESADQSWWVNSGAFLYERNGIGSTVIGALPEKSKWRSLYSKSNPVDTDDGYHPQNIFRFVTKTKWGNYSEQAYFKILKDNLSESQNRNASNGVLLFNRYQSGNTLYYAGIRVDGAVVIKKKLNGVYTTLASKKILSGTYDRDANPNLLPKNVWMGIRSDVFTNSDGSVGISLYTDMNNTGSWTLQIKTRDVSGKAITLPGYAGLRSDFMDVMFSNYKIEEK